MINKFFYIIIFFSFHLIPISSFSQHNYDKALHLSTRYLGAQRSGDTQSWSIPENMKGAFLNDGKIKNIDLSGGWHDCGDYIKFHTTGSYAALLYLYGYDKWPSIYPDNYSQEYSKKPSNGIPDILDEVKIQTDFLIKCAAHDNIIYWQVGDERDHQFFMSPHNQSDLKIYDGKNDRAVFAVDEGHSNALGNGASALALMSILYENYDKEYSKICLETAKKYYTIASKNPFVATDANNNSYKWISEYTNYYDELGLAAIMLYRATKEKQFLKDAKKYAKNIDESAPFIYANVDFLLLYELYKITNNKKYLDKVHRKVKENITAMGDNKYFHYSNWGSLRDAGNAALLAALYHFETGAAEAYKFAKTNIDFILGSHNKISDAAPKNFSFLIGYDEMGGGYPQYPHHAAAFGKGYDAWLLYDKESEKPGSVQYAYRLTGALAGGPEKQCADFFDNISNYQSSEYCIYYNAAFNSALAYITFIENNGKLTTIDNVQNIEIKKYNNFKNLYFIILDGTIDLTLINKNQNIVWEGIVFHKFELNFTELEKGTYILKDKDSNWSYKIEID